MENTGKQEVPVVVHTQLSKSEKKFVFHGNGLDYFKMRAVHLFLIIITLGIYYAWARAASLKYIYSQTEFDGSRFSFLGTGKELFSGLLKSVGIIALYVLMFVGISFIKHPMVSLLYIPLYLSFYMLIPIAIHGGMRYRMSRTSWRGIRLSYVGEQKELIMAYVKAIPFFIITLGLYASHFQVKIRRIMLNNVKIGNVRLKFTGEGDEYLGINLGGGLLSLITLGIYSFWFMKKRFNFLFGKIKIEQDKRFSTVNASMTAGGVFKNLLSSVALTVFTLGIAYPWVKIRNIAFAFNNLIIEGDVDWNSLQQLNSNQGSAMGDELALMVDAPSLFETM